MHNSSFADLELSQLMLGTVQFGFNYGINNKSGQPSYEQARDILAAAHEGGVNCLDTAASYGDSERVIGQALEELGLRDEFVVVTKSLPISNDVSQGDADTLVEESVLTSLRLLRLEVLPLCLFHNEANYRYMESLLKMKQKGLVRHVGVSCVNPETTQQIIAEGQAEAMQLPTNILDRRFSATGAFDAAKERGVALFIRSVFLQGLLMMRDEEVLPELSAVLPTLGRLRAIAQQAGLTMQELAVRYVLGLPGVTCVLTGVESVEQVRQNTRLFDNGPLAPDLMQAVTDAVPDLSENIIKPYQWSSKVPDEMFKRRAPA